MKREENMDSYKEHNVNPQGYRTGGNTMKDTQNKRKGFLKKTAALALAVMTFATSFSCDYAAVGAFAAEVTQDAAENVGEAAKNAANASKKTVKSMTARVGAAKKKRNAKISSSSDKRPDIKAKGDNSKIITTDYGWEIDFNDDDRAKAVRSTMPEDSGNQTYIITYYAGTNDTITPDMKIYYNFLDKDGKKKRVELTSSRCTITPGKLGSTENYNGDVIVQTKSAFFTSLSNANYKSPLDGNTSALNGFTLYYNIKDSITKMGSTGIVLSLGSTGAAQHERPADTSHIVTFGELDDPSSGTAAGTFEYEGGEAVKPKIFVNIGKDNSGNIIYEKVSEADSNYRYDDNTTSGTANVTATLSDVDHYGEEVSIDYTIVGRSINQDGTKTEKSNISITNPPDHTYDGKDWDPSFTIVDTIQKSDGTTMQYTLQKSTTANHSDGDYYVTFDKGDAKNAADNIPVTIHGRGNYSGEVSKTVNIKPINIAIDSTGAITDNKLTMTAEYTSGAPKISLSYALGSDSYTMKEGTDYTINGYNLTGSGTNLQISANITFKGNFAGSGTKTGTVAQGSIAEKGNTVYIYNGETNDPESAWNIDGRPGWHKVGTLTGKKDKNKDYETIDAPDDAFVYFNPTGARPTLRIVDSEGNVITDAGYEYASNPTLDKHGWPGSTAAKNDSKYDTSTASTSGTGQGWAVTVRGKGNYKTDGQFRFIFDVKKLPISNGRVTATNYRVERGVPKEDLMFDGTKQIDPSNYSVTIDTRQAGAAVPATIKALDKGVVNYSGTATKNVTNGLDLSAAIVTKDDTDAQLRVRLFDPYTGKELTGENGDPLPYYGNSVTPKFIVEKRIDQADQSGTTTHKWKMIGENQYHVELTKLEKSDRAGYIKKGTVELTGTGSELYTPENKPLRIYYYVSQNSMTGNLGTIFNADIDSITSREDLSVIGSQLGIYMRPKNIGKLLVVGTGNSSGKDQDNKPESNAYATFYDPSSTDADSAKAKDDAIYWTVPQIDNSNAKGVRLTLETDYQLSGPKMAGGQTTVTVSGINNFTGSMEVSLDQVDIGKSNDIIVSPKPKEDQPYTGNPVFPEVGLLQQSTGYIIDPTSYWVIYRDAEGHRFVLTTDKDGKYGFADSTSTTNSTEVSSIKEDTTQIDPTATAGNSQTNYAKYFKGEGEGYTITIEMKQGTDNKTQFSGSTYKTDKVVQYNIKKTNVNDKIVTSFNKTQKQVTYEGFAKDSGGYRPSGARTKLPKLPGDTGISDPGIIFSVKDRATNKDLDPNKDYTITPRTGTDDYFKYPGVKEITVSGIGEYAGIITDSYTVKGNLSRLYDPDYFTFKVGDYTFTKSETLKVYTTEYGSFKTADDQDVSLDNLTITIPGVNIPLEEDVDYRLSTKQITGSGLKTITITGLGAYSGTSNVLRINVVESRANLQWAANNTDTLEVAYRNSGYKLGTDLPIYSPYSSGNIKLTQVSKDASGNTQADTGDTVTISGTSSDGSNLDPRADQTDVSPILTKVGDYTIVISGPPAANQKSTLHLSIKYNLSTAEVTGIGGPYEYTGSDPYTDDAGFKNQIVVKVDGTQLKEGTDYTISRDKINGSYANAGQHTITISPTSYSKYWSDPEPSYYYEVTPLNIDEKMHAANLTDSFTYNGTDQNIPDSAFSDKVRYDGISGSLQIGRDFEVSYPDGKKNVGSGRDHMLRYQVVGKGNYEGSTTYGYFVINPYNIEGKADDITFPKQYYAGAGVDVIPQTLNLSGFTDPLQIDRDYTAVGKGGNNTVSRGTDRAKVTITGTGNFTGSVDKEYNIERLAIENANVTTTNLDYTGDYFTNPNDYVSVTIPVNGGKQLTYDKDYTIRIRRTADGDGNPVNEEISPVDKLIDAGDYDIIVVAKNGSDLVNGTEHTSVNLHIEPKDIGGSASDFSVSNAEWTGNPVKPDVYRGSTKVDSSWLTYSGNLTNACGTLKEMRAVNSGFSESELPTVTVKGHGNFKGSVPLHFTIGHSFESANVSVNGGRITYNGDKHDNLTFSITHPNSDVDTSKVTYEAKYPDDMVNAGVKSVVLTAQSGPLYGTKKVDVTIYPISGSAWSAEFTDLPMDSSGMYYTQYEGSAISPAVRAYVLTSGGQRTVIPLQSSEITYANNNAAGTASVTIKPQNYEGTKVLYFKILGVDISQDNNVYVAFADGITRRKYTGSAIQPKVTVTFAGSRGTVVLTQDRDYSLTYTDNTKAGAANVKITGIGNYSGSRDLPFSIWADLNDKTSTFTVPKQMYTGEPITALTGATIKAGGNDLKLGTDYTLSITSTDSFRTKGTAIFTAQGQYYEGTRTVQFDIGNDASMYNVLGVASTYVFDHQAHKPVPVVTDKQGQVYPTNSVTYQNTSDGDTCVNAGNVRMTISITSHGQTVSIPYNYIIEPRNINTATFTPLRDVDYNGKPHTPTVRITEGTRLLTGTSTSSDGSADYVVTYLNNTQPGKAQVVVTGINNYTGVSNLYFSINIKAAPQMIVTAMPSGRLKVTWNKVSGVSGYRIFYTPEGGTQKQVNVSGSKKSTYLTGLTRGVVYTVGVQSYITANGVNGYSSASVQQIATSTSKPTITSAKSTGKGRIKITWKKVSNATAYMVYRKTGNGKWSRVKTTKSTSYTNSGLKSGQKYTYKVISYKQSGVKRSFSKYSNGRTVRAK